jgi:hypothetical protein
MKGRTMPSTKPQPIILAWVLLVGLTVVSWLLGEHHETGASSLKLVSVIVTVVAFVKVVIVSQTFMELRRAAPLLQLAIVAWCLVVGTIVVSFLLAA